MIDVVSYALLCGLVLSAVLVPATALAMRFAPHLRAESRHAIWLMVLAATAAAPIAALAVSALRPARELSGVVAATAPPAVGAPHATGLPLAALGAIVLAGWLVVAVAQTFRVARRVAALRALKHRALPVAFEGELPRGARALASESGVPAAVGFFHPAILLPETLGTLDPIDARQLVLHEAAHLRRCDDVTGLVFHLCAALYWFNPFVHYIGTRLSLECEIACDETVVEQTGDARRYATLLFEMAETMTQRNSQLGWNAFAHPHGLVTRMRNLLLHEGTRRTALSRPALAALMLALLSGAGLAAFSAPAFARANDDASTRVYQQVRGDTVTENGRATKVTQRVRALPACTVPKSHRDAGLCEAPSAKVSVTTRIKKEGATP